MTAFVAFMNGVFGHSLRVLVGLAFIVYGLLVFGGTTGVAMAVIGLVPIGLGLWGHCLLEPFVPHRRVTS